MSAVARTLLTGSQWSSTHPQVLASAASSKCRPYALATVASFVVYGVPGPEARKILGSFGADYMIPFDGFSR